MIPKEETPKSVHNEEYDWYECETIEVIGNLGTEDVLRSDVNIQNYLGDLPK